VSTKVSKTVRESETAPEVAVFKQFLDALVEGPRVTVDNAAIGVGANRLCFRERDQMPHWVKGCIDLDIGRPVSSKEMLYLILAMDTKALEALLEAIAITKATSRRGRNLFLTIKFELCKRILEPALRALMSPRTETIGA
jgi:hypothetical protein